MKKGYPTFFLVPTNEGQDLNYSEHHIGTINTAKDRAKDIVKGLEPVLYQGSISCRIEDADNNGIVFYDNGKWVECEN